MENKMKLGSLFDGSGGFPLAGTICGITPVWASEIEPYPISVTKARFPEMKHLGSITQINGAEIEPVDIITFGSPCQDLSVAGKQKGIHEGERSNLFFEAIRIIHEMREATDHRYPRYAVWENVPGAFSSNKGHDFRAVLQAFCDEADQERMFLCLKKENGSMPDVSWETVSALPGGSTTLNFGESPSVARESTLSQILEANAPEKYYLSAKTCEGILRRAERRGKTLPPTLKEALLQMIERERAQETEADEGWML